RAILRRPGLQLHLTDWGCPNRRKPRLQRAENDTLLDKPVVAAVIALGEGSITKRTMVALKASRKRGHGPRDQYGTHHAGPRQRRGRIDAVWTSQARILRRGRGPRRPSESRM